MGTLLDVCMDVVNKGKLHNLFSENIGTTLIPIVFSHGVTSNRTMSSGTCRDLASHGYIVFAIDHHDGTCSYYENDKGEGTTHSGDFLFLLDLRKKQLAIRE